MDGRLERGGAPRRTHGVGRPRVLIIDDDTRLRDVLGLVLADDCEVTLAASADEGLERLRVERFDAIVCDLTMPRMGGAELHELLAQSDPDAAARMVIVTGGACSREAEQFLEQSGCPKVSKPFSPPELMDAVQQIVERRGRALRRAG